MKKILKITGILLLGLFIISCGGKQENSKSGNSEGKLKVKVGTEGSYAPFTFTDDSGKLTGYDVEVVEDKFSAIKKLYPNALDEQIKKAISILESRLSIDN